MPTLSQEFDLSTGSAGTSALGLRLDIRRDAVARLVARRPGKATDALCLMPRRPRWSWGCPAGSSLSSSSGSWPDGEKLRHIPDHDKVATAWFPECERGRGIAFYTSRQLTGLALLTPVLSWLQTVLTRHSVFSLTDAISIVGCDLVVRLSRAA